jgi:hypothetical protein
MQTWLLYLAAVPVLTIRRRRALAFNRISGAAFVGSGALLATVERG